jgi:uracil-DNA glycosylase
MNEENLKKLFRGWWPLVENFFKSAEYESLLMFLKQRKAQGAEFTPPKEHIFNAYKAVSPEDVKVVLLGQDPYPHYHANGLSFSSTHGNQVPASLANVFKELNAEYGDEILEGHTHETDLTRWAIQGVLLLNTVLTSEFKNAGAHLGQGWEDLTARTLINLVRAGHKDQIVFLLLGQKALKFIEQKVIPFITPEEECRISCLQASHPSPYSANQGFIGSNIFKDCNNLLTSAGEDPIDWIGPMKDILPF